METDVVDDRGPEGAVAQGLSAWFRTQHGHFHNPDGTYRGWVTDFGYTLDGQTPFGLDLRLEDHRWALFVLAVGWSYTGQWENSAAFIGVLAELDLLRYERWVSEGVDSVFERASAHLERRLAARPDQKFPFPWKEGVGGHQRRRVSFPSQWRLGLRRAVAAWPQVDALLAGAMADGADGAAFIREFLEGAPLAGLSAIPGKPDRRMRVKVPMLLRELRAQGLSRVSPAFCVIPDMRVKKMRETLGLSNGGQDVEGFLLQLKRIAEAYGDLYDMPLFAFWEVCGANAASSHPEKFVDCRGCPVQGHCATYARRAT